MKQFRISNITSNIFKNLSSVKIGEASLFGVLIIAATLNSCNIYKPYSRPELNIDKNLFRDVEAENSTNSGNLSWEEMFTDPYLQALIRKGLENNTDIKIAYLRTEQAKATLSSAKLAFTPSLNIPVQGVLSSFDGAKTTKTYDLPVTASWEIDAFGRLQNAKKRSKAAYEQSLEYKQAVRTGFISGIANSYYTLLLLDSQLEVSEKTALNWRTNVETMRELKKAGMANEAAVSQSEANYFSIEASLHNLRYQIYEVENTITTMLGENPGAIERGKLRDQNIPTRLSIGIPLQILSYRPDVKMAELSLSQAYYATNEARSNFYPSLVLNGSAGWTNNVGSMIINPGKLLLTAVGSLTQPVFNQGKNRALLKINQAQQEEALLNFQQTVLNAGAEVINSLKQIETAESKIAFRRQQITSLETAVSSTELLMRHGSSTYLEVLIAQQNLLSAQLTQIADNFEKIQGVVNLYHALGGGRE